MLVIRNITQLLAGTTGVVGAAICVNDHQITWIGQSADLQSLPPDAEVIDAAGKTILPGLIDSHTHLIFAGSREDEFEQRLQGKTYQEIAAHGGGINATVRRVRQASKEELKRLARPRLQRMMSFGVTTVEVKSGYGLSLEDELKCLEAIAELNAEGPVELVPTFLGAHAVPPEYQSDRDGYIRVLCNSMLPEVARNRLAEFCDVFCEKGVFSVP
ncbi:MAG TPA: amidohydrolase family protein, partial [Gemmataceae bacterium]